MKEGKKTKSRAILVFGAPCSGKTTFAEKFAEKYHLTFYNLDEVRESGDFSRKQLMKVLEFITRTKQNLILEGGMNTEKERNEIRRLFRIAEYTPSLVWVQTDIATIRSRLKTRHKSVAEAKDFYDRKVAEIEAPSEIEMPIILSGKHTFETQSRHVLAGLADN